MKDLIYINTSYSTSIELPRSATDVFNHLIELSKWWPEDYEGEPVELNTEFVFKTGEEHYSKNRITELELDKKLTWVTLESIRRSDGYDWTGTKMIFELTPVGDNTNIKFTYDGVVPEQEAERLMAICDMTLKDLFYNFIMNGKAKQNSFTISVSLDKSPHDVFKYLTQDVSKWWGGKDLLGNTTNLNDEFIVHHVGTHFSKQQIVEIVPDKKLVWLVTLSQLDWLEKDKAEWTGTKMIFELIPDDKKTIIRFTHEGLDPGKESYDRCSHGWSMVIKEWLYRFIMEGKSMVP